MIRGNEEDFSRKKWCHNVIFQYMGLHNKIPINQRSLSVGFACMFTRWRKTKSNIGIYDVRVVNTHMVNGGTKNPLQITAIATFSLQNYKTNNANEWMDMINVLYVFSIH